MEKIILVLVIVLATALSNSVSFVENEGSANQLFRNDAAMKSENTYLNNVNEVIKNQEALDFPVLKAEQTNSRNFASTAKFEARKKSKIKKIKKGLKKAFVPILIFILVKAMILIPLALAILAFKTWNALQLSFVSFVTGLALAFWKFCNKANQDDHLPVVHGGWELDRSDGQMLAYSGYVPQ